MMQALRAVCFWILADSLLALSVNFACAQTSGAGPAYPNKPIRVLVSPVGGGGDFAARLIAQGLSANIGQQVIVDNRSGVLAIEITAKAPADGYTVLLYSGALWLIPLMQSETSWDPVKDFSNITCATSAPTLLVLHPSVAAKTIKELIALAKAKPGELNYASGSTGSPPQLAAELFKHMAGVNIVRVNYKGTAPSLTALLGGEVQMVFATPGSVEPHIKAGRLRSVAVTSALASPLYPGIPTVAESGLPGYESTAIQAIFAPARLPASFNNTLNREIVRVIQTPAIRERFLTAGYEVVGSTSEQLTAMRTSYLSKWGKVIKEGGLR